MNKLETLVIDKRFCGPTESGNGGYVCGRLAAHVRGDAQVRLISPPPLDTPLEVWSGDEKTVLLRDGDRDVAAAMPARLEMEVPSPISYEAAGEAARAYSGYRYHPFPHCFVCGPERSAEDGLRIFPGTISPGTVSLGTLRREDDGDVRETATPGAPQELEALQAVAAPWVPDASLCAAGGDTIKPEYVWAALDCAGAFALGFGPENVLLLGQFTVGLRRPVKVGERCVVMGWCIGVDGRKHYAGTAVFNAGGELCGAGKAVWIQLR